MRVSTAATKSVFKFVRKCVVQAADFSLSSLVNLYRPRLRKLGCVHCVPHKMSSSVIMTRLHDNELNN